jgi:uncharacterized LabA/DUF88 family protein
MTLRNAGSPILMKTKKRAIVFIDGNNWYHNVQSVVDKPRTVDFRKLSNQIAKHFNINIVEIRYYNSIPDIELGEEVYYKHMMFLAGLKQKNIKVSTAKLKKMRVNGKSLRVEKGIDVLIAVDMIRKTLLENECDCCALISGDSDFVPAMRLIKKSGKEVLTTSVLRGYARELLQGEFRFWIMKKPDVEKCLGGYNGK